MIAFFLPKFKRYLELDTETKITITATTPLTDIEHLSRVYTFDFSVPVNPNNDAALRHVHRIDSRFGAQDLACECQVGGVFVVGKLSVVDVSTAYRISFVSESRDILSELDYDISTFAQETITLLPTGATVQNANTYTFELFGDLSVSDTHYACRLVTTEGVIFLADWSGSIDTTSVLDELADKINVFFAVAIVATVANNILTVNVPVVDGKEAFEWDYAAFTHVRLLNSITGYQVNNGLIATRINEINRDTNADFCFPTVYAPNFYENNEQFYKRVNNADIEGKMFQNIFSETKDNCINTFVPMFKVDYILKKIATRLKLVLGGTWYSEADAKKLIIFNTKNLDKWGEQGFWTRIYASPLVTGFEDKLIPKYINYCNHEVKPSDHLPKMTARTFLQTLCHDFGIYIEVEGGVLKLNKKRDLIDLLAKNRTAEIISNSLRFEPRKDENLKIGYNFGTETIVPTGQLTPVILNPTAKIEKKYELFGTLPMSESEQDFTIRRMPHYFGVANSDQLGFLFYRGIVANNTATAIYPYATHDNLDPNLQEIGDWSLSPSGEKGLYEIALKGIAELELSQELELELNPALADIVLGNNYGRLFAYSPFGQFEAVPKQIRLRFANRNLDSVSMTLLIL